MESSSSACPLQHAQAAQRPLPSLSSNTSTLLNLTCLHRLVLPFYTKWYQSMPHILDNNSPLATQNTGWQHPLSYHCSAAHVPLTMCCPLLTAGSGLPKLMALVKSSLPWSLTVRSWRTGLVQGENEGTFQKLPPSSKEGKQQKWWVPYNAPGAWHRMATEKTCQSNESRGSQINCGHFASSRRTKRGWLEQSSPSALPGSCLYCLWKSSQGEMGLARPTCGLLNGIRGLAASPPVPMPLLNLNSSDSNQCKWDRKLLWA